MEKPYCEEVALHEERLERAATKSERKEERILWTKFEAAAQTGWNIVLEPIEINTQKKIMVEKNSSTMFQPICAAASNFVQSILSCTPEAALDSYCLQFYEYLLGLRPDIVF
jgi:hypothetical protein